MPVNTLTCNINIFCSNSVFNNCTITFAGMLAFRLYVDNLKLQFKMQFITLVLVIDEQSLYNFQ